MSLTKNFQQINDKVFPGGNPQAAVAYLGRLALDNLSLSDLMVQAVMLTTQVLPADYALIWELLDDNKSLLLMNNTGLPEGLVPRLQTHLDPDSLEGYTLASPDVVMMKNLSEEVRFRVSGLAMRQTPASGMSALIGTLEKPYAILEVFSQQVQSFSQEDADFLQSVANILALVLQQGRREEDLVIQNQKLMKELVRAQFMTPSGHFEWDRYEVKTRLIENRERERLHLAQELHDAPIQDLYGLIYQLDDLRNGLKDPSEDGILDECNATLHKVIDSLRTTCRELRPPSLSPFGLEVAIRDHVEKFRESNPDLRIHLDLIQDKQLLSDSLRLSLYRIYQQAIHNVVRHAQATEVYIRLRFDDDMVVLEVEDNGEGFQIPENWLDLAREEHFGLLGIAERVESIRGKLEILSALGGGTLIRAIIPLF